MMASRASPKHRAKTELDTLGQPKVCPPMRSRLNFHHLHYFWVVAKEGNLTRAASQLNISQSALSTQIKQLEFQLGQPLFARTGRTLTLTVAGQVALQHADLIFATGTELVVAMKHCDQPRHQAVRIGVVVTVSHNLQEGFIGPLLTQENIEVAIQLGQLEDLLTKLGQGVLDLVLSNQRVPSSTTDPWITRTMGYQPIRLIGPPTGRWRKWHTPTDLDNTPLLLPPKCTDIRADFDRWCDQHAVRYQVRAQVDDFELLRAMAWHSGHPALLPPALVADELSDGRLVVHHVVPELRQQLLGITFRGRFEPSVVTALFLPAA